MSKPEAVEYWEDDVIRKMTDANAWATIAVDDLEARICLDGEFSAVQAKIILLKLFEAHERSMRA